MKVLRVEQPGLFTTLQDLGRSHHRASGVPVSGAMDRFALAAANRLVGNPDGAGALECLLSGPTLEAVAPCLVAVTGGDLGLRVNDHDAPAWTSLFLAEGDRLSFAGRRLGARAYLAVAGGFAGDRWLGSVSTFLLVGRGGIHGRPLKAGDSLELAADPPRPLVSGRNLPEAARPPYVAPHEVAVLDAVAGPQAARLSPASRKLFHTQEYEVSKDADRMGFRLEGEPLEVKGPELISFGLAFGCVQVPWSGKPILLMADHQTAGGYPVAAGVVRASLPIAAQLVPGDRLRFRETTIERAQARWRELHAGLDLLR